MEKQAKDDATSSKAFPSKIVKQHHSTTDTPVLDDKNQRVVTTTDSSKSLDFNMNIVVISLNQQLTESAVMNYKFGLPLKEYCNLAPEEKFELPLAGSKSLQTRKVWHKALEGEHSA